MSLLRTSLRIFQISRIFGRYRIGSLILSNVKLPALKALFYANPWRWFPVRNLTRGERLRLAMEELGPVFVKFGQALSTRRDLLPDDISNELAKLQDKVPPFPGAESLKIVSEAFGKAVDDVFTDFDANALASASVAQVHTAKLPDGQDVVVKIIRPGIQKRIKKDLDLMYTLANFVDRFLKIGERLKPIEVVDEFKQSLHDELDLQNEAANASQLRRNFEGSEALYVPEIYWDYCNHDVLTMERIHGIPISNIAELKRLNVNLHYLAELGVEIFFTQVFRDCFFHADMHPGNIFVDASNPEKPRYIAVDFGIIGTLIETDQHYLAENFLAFFNRDYRRVAVLHVESGWVPADTRVDQFESAIRAVCEPIFERPLKDISFGQVLIRLFQTASRFNMPVQPQLILLQKTLVNIEGLGRQLYPELDLWATAKPFLQKWLKERVGIKTFCKNIAQEAPLWLEKLPDIPNLMYRGLEQLAHKPQQATLQTMEKQEVREQRSARGFWLGAAVALLVSGTATGIIYEQIAQVPRPITHLGWGLLSGAILCLIAGAFTRRS